jgi:dTMP kinase
VPLVPRGRFITLEGGEGTGKSTQARRLAERLVASGVEVVQTREPGGSEGAEALRRLLLEGGADRWSTISETLLMYAARRDHLEKLIRPALERGAWVVCDRFFDSTRAYQGAGGGAPEALIAALEQQVVGADRPDLTLVLDLPVEIGLERAGARAGLDRIEARARDFHQRLRQGFLDIAARQPDRCAVIDAAPGPDEVAEHMWRAVQARLGVAA